MGKYKNLMSVIKTITDIGIMSNDINVKTVEHLGTIAPDVATNISLLKGWMKGDTIYAEEESSADETKQPSEVSPLLTEGGYYRFDPDADWKQVFDPPVWCSTSGLIYSEEKDELLIPRYHNGDYMVTIDPNDAEQGKKRAGVLVARAFRIQSDDRLSDQNVLEYRDGDRKNICPENLYWRQSEQYNLQQRTVEDICRRIIEFNGDFDKIMDCYDPNDRFASKQFVRSVFEKTIFQSISDRFFVRTLSGKIVVKQTVDTRPIGHDIGEFLRKTEDLSLAKQLLVDKIKEGKNSITVDEEAIMVITAVVDVKTTSNKAISKYIRDVYKYTIPFDTIETWKSAKSNKLYQIIGGSK